MKKPMKPKVQQKTERRISAGVRLALVAVLLVAQIALTIFLSVILQQKVAFAYSLLELAALVCAVYVFNRQGSDTYKMVWILLILTFPVVGVILYFLWNGTRQDKHLDLKKLSFPQEPTAEKAKAIVAMELLAQNSERWSILSNLLENRGFPLYRGTQMEYLPSGEEALGDMIEKMRRAEHFIFMEYFIFAEGEILDRMMDIFYQKAQQGVEIKIIYDDFGSMMRMPPEAVDRLRRTGAEVRIFNPVHHYVNRLYFNYRDHRKITCIDGDIAYTGGMNIADEYANLIVRFGHWKDCGLRLEGAGAWGLTREFLFMWERMGESFSEERDYYRPRDTVVGEGFCQSIVDGPDNNPEATAEDLFLRMISLGKRQVYITTPYLMIDEPMKRALCLAGDSGLDVRLIVPGVPDHKLAYLAAEAYFGELIEHGVQIYTYTPGLIHGKTVMVDKEAAFVGSVNMDYRSFQLHFECGTVIYYSPEVTKVYEDQMRIMERSHLVTYGEWKKRPWYRKAVGIIMKLFAMWM